jgi:syndecan 4
MNCSGNGICNRGTCLCVDGFQGAGCQDPISATHNAQQLMASFLEVEETIHSPHSLQPAAHTVSLPTVAHVQMKATGDCSNHGTLSNGKCFCEPGWTGETCSQEFACPNACSQHGQCQRGLCFCDPGYIGSDCSDAVACPNDCSGNGVCWNGRCSCNAGYEGSDCSDSKPRGDLSGLTVTEMVIVSILAFAVGLFLGLVLKSHLDARKKAKFNQMLQQEVNRPFVSAP